MSGHRCYAVCIPGLEALLLDELTELGVRPGSVGRGGVPFRATTRQLYATNLWSRLATRVLVRLDSFAARSFSTLERSAAELPWGRYLDPASPPVFRVTSHGSRLYHGDAVAERLARVAGVEDPSVQHAQDEPDGGEDRQLVVVRIVRDRVTISIDSSGAPLHKRGWRPRATRAALRETLAAALVRASGWTAASPLVDPFCGSGTIPIEAALVARDIAPGSGRRFAFADWPSFEPGTWASVAGEATARGRPSVGVPIVACDRDDGAVEIASEAAERAGVGDDVAVFRSAISDLAAPEGSGPGWLLTDPPHGVRLTGGDLRDLYARFGAVARERFAGWDVGMLVADRRLAAHTGLSLHERFRASAGSRPVEFVATAPHRGAEPERAATPES